MPRKVTSSIAKPKAAKRTKTARMAKSLPEMEINRSRPELPSPIIESAVATETQNGIALGVLTICALALLAVFGFSIMAGIVAVSTASSPICSDSLESKNDLVISNIPYYDLFVKNVGTLLQIKHFDIYNKSKAICKTTSGSSSYEDKCLIDICTGNTCANTAVASCVAGDRNCRLQEGFITYVTSTPKVGNWIYKCPNGCNNGACIKTPVCTDSDLSSSQTFPYVSGNSDPFLKGVTTGLADPMVSSTGGTVSMTDSCYSANELSEFYCSSGKVVSTGITCNNGCFNGACLAKPITNWNPSNINLGVWTNWTNIAGTADGKNQLVGAVGGSLYYSTDYGHAWSKLSSAGIKKWSSVAMSNDLKYFSALVGPDGSYSYDIYVATSSGGSWTKKKSVKNALNLNMSANGKCIIVSGNPPEGIVVSSDYGNTWSTSTLSSKLIDRVAITSDCSRVFAIDYQSGSVNVSFDGGKTWSVTGGSSRFKGSSSFSISSSGQLQFISLNNGDFFISENYGASYSKVSSGNGYMKMAFAPIGKKLLGGNEYILESSDLGGTWSVFGPKGNWYQFFISENGNVKSAAFSTKGVLYYK